MSSKKKSSSSGSGSSSKKTKEGKSSKSEKTKSSSSKSSTDAPSTTTPPTNATAPLTDAVNPPQQKNAFPGDFSSLLPFEAGQIFSKYDHDGDGKLSKLEFTELVRQNRDLLRSTVAAASLYGPSSYASGNGLPAEIASHRILTHFDETAGVAISRGEAEQHTRQGHVVVTLAEAYKQRYDRLRTILTSKLMPKREYMLQLYRQLQHISGEVEANRRSIERETLTDTEQILERLRTAESMRQSTIRHQMLRIEEELATIERIIRRVERANIEESNNNTTGTATGPGLPSPSSMNVMLTSAYGTTAPAEVLRTPQATAMVEIIHEYSDLQALIDRTASKTITVQVDFPTDDFPKETAERLEVLARCDRYMNVVQAKDHMLWLALRTKEKLESQLAEEKQLSAEYAGEVTQWAEMTQQLASQLSATKQENESLQAQVQELTRLLRAQNVAIHPNVGSFHPSTM